MKVAVNPVPSSLSKAMYRVADALERYAPAGVKIVTKGADIQVLHVIGNGENVKRITQPKVYAVIQYLFLLAGNLSELKKLV